MMFKKSMQKLIDSRVNAKVKQELLMDAVRKATQNGCCVILKETKGGTRIIVLGRSTYQDQLSRVARDKGVVI
jgi:hypothetical protein